MAPKADGRRKSGGKSGLVVTLKVPSSRLRDVIRSETPESKSTAPRESTEPKELVDSPAPSANLVVSGLSNGDNATDSNVATPVAEGTPAPSSMAPPIDGRKKGAKRSAATIDGVPKARGKPGPKKKPRLYVYLVAPSTDELDAIHSTQSLYPLTDMVCFTVRTAQSTIMQWPGCKLPSLVPRPTKEPSTPVCELSIDLANLAASGRGAASSLKASQVFYGRFLAGQPLPRRRPMRILPNQALYLPRPTTAAARRTSPMDRKTA